MMEQVFSNRRRHYRQFDHRIHGEDALPRMKTLHTNSIYTQ
jgi:hypothetical protein